MVEPAEFQQALDAAITALQAQRAALGDALVDAALAPLLARRAALGAQPATAQPTRRLRQVSVLFLDIVGSTQLIQQLDPEEVQVVVDGALAAFTIIVTRHGGEVLRYAGDSLKVAFGAHDTIGTREDDAERAVHCGLALLAEAARRGKEIKSLHSFEGFNARVGIHTGSVVRGGGVENDKSLSGITVNIAARLEQATPAGTLCISQDTWVLVRGAFEAQAQPPLKVKGVDAPLNSYRVLAARERSVAVVERGLQGLSTPMVGRLTELQQLLQAATQARQTQQLRALTLLGDAGLGKSRLLREFKAALLRAAESSQPLTVRAQPDGQLRPWGLLRSVLAVQCGVADTDSAEVARRKVVDGLSPCFAEAGERGERQAELIGQLSGLDYTDSPNVKGLDPRALRDQALTAFRSYLRALATRGEALLVMLVEDLHWCDDGSLDLLQDLLAHAAELPLLLVMTARPVLLTRRPDWAAPATPAHAVLSLQPLAATHGDELARALLQRMAEVPPRLMQAITSQAEGNPYYMEELVRRLIDDGVITTDGPRWQVQAERLDILRLPTTLVGLLQARLDALPAAQRQAARLASVIGHVFWDDALQALDAQAPQALPALQRTAYVRTHETTDFEGTAERQFDHHLLHQVTYGTLLKAERKLGHGAAARWLAKRTQGRGAEFMAMTGEHAEQAGETALAIDCFDQAGAQAQMRYANAIAQAYLRRAVSLLGDSQPLRCFDLLSRMEKIADVVADRSAQEQLHIEMAAVLERHPDDERQAGLWFSIGLLADRRSDKVAAQHHTLRASALAQACGAAKTAAMSQGQLGWLGLIDGDLKRAQEHMAIAMHWAGQMPVNDDRTETECKLLLVSAMLSSDLGRFNEAQQSALAVFSRAQSLNSPRLQLGALDALVAVHESLGQWQAVIECETRALTLAEAIGANSRVGLAQCHLAQAAEALGDHNAALRLHHQVLQGARAVGDRRVEATSLQHLGQLHHQRNEPAAALHWHRQAQTLFEALSDDPRACEAAASAALCESLLGHTDTALTTVNRLMQRLQTDLTDSPAHETLPWRWGVQRALATMGDSRATPLLAQLYLDVQARAAALTDAADRDRLIQSLPVWRAIVAAHGRPPLTS